MVSGFLYIDLSGIILILCSVVVGASGGLMLLGYWIGRMAHVANGDQARLALLRPYLVTGCFLLGLAALGALVVAILSNYGHNGRDARETADAVAPVLLVFLAFLVPIVLVNWRKHLRSIHFPDEVQG